MADERTKSEGRKFPKRVLSGIQPTGELHLGNYLGAVKNWVALQETDADCFYCVVDYHAITVEHDPSVLSARTLEMAKDLLACGVDPQHSTLFIQSQLPEHTELSWILSAVAAYGDLTRMTQFKDKGDKQEFVSVGLFTYPVLQAADILAYQATGVPVGEDQVQHLELTRGIARRFNARFGEMFPETDPILTKGSKILSPMDPTSKMSKSLGEQHVIGLFEDEGSIRKKVKRHVTGMGDEDAIPAGVLNLLTILQNTAPDDVYQQFLAQAEDQSLRYSELKPAVADHLMNALTPIRDRRDSYSNDDVKDVVREGAKKAREVAAAVVAEARNKIGLLQI